MNIPQGMGMLKAGMWYILEYNSTPDKNNIFRTLPRGFVRSRSWRRVREKQGEPGTIRVCATVISHLLLIRCKHRVSVNL